MTGSWLTGFPRTLDYPDAGIDAVLAGSAHSFPGRIALRDGEQTLTFGELAAHAARVAGGLRARGVMPGDVVAISSPNSLWYVVSYYGVLCAGAAVAPVNPALPAPMLREQLEDVRAAAVIAHQSSLPVVAAAGADCVRFTVGLPPTQASPVEAGAFDAAGSIGIEDLLASEALTGYRVDPRLVAHLQLTGGTTGRSKSVRVLQRNLVSNVLQFACWRSMSLPVEQDGRVSIRQVEGADPAHALIPGECVYIAVAPLFHGLGLVGQNLNTILGATTVFTGRFDPERLLADIARYGATHMTGSPTMYYALLRSGAIGLHDLSSVRMISSGAAPIDTTALEQLASAFPNAIVSEGYGLSEATMGVTSAPVMSDIPTPRGSVGVAVFDTTVEIRDAEQHALPAGEPGEVWVRGPQVTDGYEGRPDLNAVQFRDGWLATGDMGTLDEHGHLFLVGRSKDMIIYKGYNVYPQPLEEILCSHPGVAQAAVVGRPDPDAGEVPVAFIVRRTPGPADETPDKALADEVMAFVASAVAPYQKVRSVYVVDELPATPTGKIVKNELRARLEKE